MSRTALVVGFTVLLIVLAAVPSAYGLRWSYCRKRLVGYENPGCILPDFNVPAWSDIPAHDMVIIDRWIAGCSLLYENEPDWLLSMSENERFDLPLRHWADPASGEPPFFFAKVEPKIANGRSHLVDYRLGHPALSAHSVAPDGMTEVSYHINSKNAFTFLDCKSMIDSSPTPIEVRFNYFESIGNWKARYEFDKTTYRLEVSTHPLQSSRYIDHKHRFDSSENFVDQGIDAINDLEQELARYLGSDAPTKVSAYKVDHVDVVKCSCEEVDHAANRPLTLSERTRILADAKVELEHRRSLLREHGEVWFKTLQKILIDVE